MPGDLGLLATVFLQLLYFSLLLLMLPAGKLIDSKSSDTADGGNNCHPDEADLLVIDKIYRAATFYLRYLWRSDKPCLRRSLLLHRWCRLRKIPARLLIGVKKKGVELQSHAWLEIASIPIGEEPEELNSYTIILEG